MMFEGACSDRRKSTIDGTGSADGSQQVAAAPAPRRPEQVTLTNACLVYPAKDGVKRGDANQVGVAAVLDGTYGREAEQIFMSGDCHYVSGAETVYPWQRLHTWRCDFKMFTTGFPPQLIEEDLRGDPQLAQARGADRPQPEVNGPDTSDSVFRMDELLIRGPGTFSINCPHRDRKQLDALAGCRIAWYSDRLPDEMHYSGVCGERVTVRGVFTTPRD